MSKWDYTSEYKLSLQQERTLKRYAEFAENYVNSSNINKYGIDPNKLEMSNTVKNHYDDVFTKNKTVQIGDGYKTTHYAGESTRPYVNNGSSMIMNEIMEAGTPISDPRGVVNALRWDVPGYLNNTAGTWELVINVEQNQVIHFLFNSK